MEEYEILIRSLKDSAADSRLKLLKEGETFGEEKPGGEKRLHIGSMSEEKKWDGFFFPNGGKTFNVIVSKIDLIKYMFEAKNEYFNPHQSYRLKISDFYNNLYNQTLRIPQESFEICFEKNTDKSRYYLSRPSSNPLSKNYKYIIEICLPIVTEFAFIRLKVGESYVFYLKPEFKPGYITPDSVKKNPIYKENLQQIYYGAPGTGKSHDIKEETKGYSVIRTTFHPDSDYSTFVGAYKPTMNKENCYGLNGSTTVQMIDPSSKNPIQKNIIEYRFVKQAFLKAYLLAWKKYSEGKFTPLAGSGLVTPIEQINPNITLENNRETEETYIDPVFLVIEEINRGNCAQIFGDLFQLLDRQDNGFSEYPIEADTDLQKEIENAFKNEKEYQLDGEIKVDGVVEDYVSNQEKGTLSKDIQEGRILLLPPNLFIWATMNTSDQSLFPIDSAFKRRWEWKYIKIKNQPEKSWKIGIEYDVKDESTGTTTKEKYDWWKFLEKINGIINNMTSSADKQLGYFFCKANKKENDSDSEPTIITKETFVSKVIFYLWNDVFKDYGFADSSLFQYKVTEDGKEITKDLTFPDFYNEDGKNVNEQRVKEFIDNVMKWGKEERSEK